MTSAGLESGPKWKDLWRWCGEPAELVMWDAWNLWGLSGLFVTFGGLTPGILDCGKTKRLVLLVEEKTIGNPEEMRSLHLKSWCNKSSWETELRRYESIYVILLIQYYVSLPQLLIVLTKLFVGRNSFYYLWEAVWEVFNSMKHLFCRMTVPKALSLSRSPGTAWGEEPPFWLLVQLPLPLGFLGSWRTKLS